MTTDASQNYFPSLPPTFGWRRVVELADEFKLTTADMLTICDRLGVTATDASQWLDAATVDRIRDVVGLKGPGALLKEPKPPKPPKVEKLKEPKPPKLVKVEEPKPAKEPKPPKAVKVKEPKPAKPPKLVKVKEPKPAKPPKVARSSGAPEMGSVSRDGVRTRNVIAIAVLIVALAVGIGVVVEYWVDAVTNTDAPATVVTSDDQ